MLKVKLNNGVEMPQLGIGTYNNKTDENARDMVGFAFKNGYIHVDTAHAYYDEKGVGQGIKDAGVKREDIWITSKLWPTEYGEGKTLEAIDKMLKRIDTPYLDLVFLHQPVGDYIGAYKDLEKLIEYIKTSDDIESFFYKREHPDIRYLEEAMIIIMRAKYSEYKYSLNPGVIEKLKRLFSRENKVVAKRYGEIENLTVGMLYTYGIVDFDFLRKQICKYMKEIITERELRDIYFTRLNLNTFVNDYDIRWTNTNEIQCFVTYLDEEDSLIDIGQIAEEQKARKMQYKQFEKQEILKREEYLWNEKTQELYNFVKSKNDDVHIWEFKRLIKNNELGIDILGELSNMCIFKDDFELKKFMELFTDWYNNSPQYILGGNTPNESKRINH